MDVELNPGPCSSEHSVGAEADNGCQIFTDLSFYVSQHQFNSQKVGRPTIKVITKRTLQI
jgi:hypothetical protein